MCVGCYRLPFEIKHWWLFTEDKRQEITNELDLRKEMYGEVL